MSLRSSLERYASRLIDESCAQPASASAVIATEVGNQGSRKNSNSHIDASHSRQPLVKGERLVRYEVNAVMLLLGLAPRWRRSQAVEHEAVVLLYQVTRRMWPAPRLLGALRACSRFAGSIQSPIASRGAG